VQAYPALVETDNGVDLRLLESQVAATAASRDGIRRLFMIELGLSPSKLDAQLPASLEKSLRRMVALRAIDETFELFADPASLPRDKASFQARLAAHRAQFAPTLAQLVALTTQLIAELGKVQSALKPLVGKPGIARAVVEDVQSQLSFLAPTALLGSEPWTRIGHVLRYLRAVGVRLQRQSHDPQKDQQKAAQVVPLWQSFVARRAELVAKRAASTDLDDVRWQLEELRVHVFAPELTTAVRVSPETVKRNLERLGR
jgi:ATP-dependent helicase HrpA